MARQRFISTTKTIMNEIANPRTSSPSQQSFCYLPEIETSDMVCAYSGIRAKLTPPAKHGEKRVADFIIQPEPEFPRVIQLIGIESPGLTYAPAIAEYVSGLLAEILP